MIFKVFKNSKSISKNKNKVRTTMRKNKVQVLALHCFFHFQSMKTAAHLILIKLNQPKSSNSLFNDSETIIANFRRYKKKTFIASNKLGRSIETKLPTSMNVPGNLPSILSSKMNSHSHKTYYDIFVFFFLLFHSQLTLPV